MPPSKKRNGKTMLEVTKNYETFIKGEKVENNKQLFEEVLKKAIKPTKLHGSK